MEDGEEDWHTEEEDGENEVPKGTLKCTECDRTFTSASKLRSHARVHAGQNLFGCKHCPAKFVYENQLKLHSKIHEGSGGYSCARCPAKFTLAWSLKLHEKTHVTKKAFPCPECSAKFDSEDNLKEHKESHRFPYACMQCTARFGTARDLWEHENVHNDEGSGSDLDEPEHVEISVATEQDSGKNVSKKKLHGCRQCSTWFVSVDHLQQHKCTNTKTPIEEKPYQCSKCPEKFAYKKSLKEHEKKHAKKTQFSAGASSKGLSKTVNLTDSTAGSKKKNLKEHERKNAQKTQCTTEAGSELESLSEIVDLTESTAGPQNTPEYDSLPKGQRKTVKGKTLHTCPQCDAAFPTNSKLNRHLKVHAGKLEHHCSQCPASFSSIRGLRKHEKRHGRPQSSSCTQRPAKFTIRSNLQKQGKSHKGAKPFSCPECPAKFVSYVEKKSHMEVHGKAHTCSHCGAKFAHYNSLVSHQRCHQVEKRKVYSCTSCPAKFAQPHSLRLHQRIHGPVVYSCPECPATFKNQGHLGSHMLVHSGGDKPYKCQYCSAKYTRTSHLSRHEKLHQEIDVATLQPTEASSTRNEGKQGVEHEQTGKKRKRRDQEASRPSNKSLNCKECPAKFTSTSHLWSHMQVHFGEDKPHHCPHCSAKFASPYQLTRHLQFHNGTDKDSSPPQDAEARTPEVPRKKQKKQQPPVSNVRYSCSICSEEFMDPENLKVHWRTHTSRYSCDKCPSSFVHSDLLRQHQKAHNNDGQLHSLSGAETTTANNSYWKCPHCFRRFETFKTLKRHSKYCFLVIGNRPYKRAHTCSHCPAKFAFATTLERHMKSHNGVEPHDDQQDAAASSSTIELPSSTTSRLTRAGDDGKNYHCEECPAKFSTERNLKRHLEVHDSSKPKPYSCSYCTAKFSVTGHLAQHVKIHNEVPPPQSASERVVQLTAKKRDVRVAYRCNVCDATFTTQAHLNTHKKVHLQDNLYSCSKCPAKFALQSDLADHEKTHTASNQVSSEAGKSAEKTCTAKSKDSDARKTKWFTCQYCKSNFRGASRLAVHVNVHHWEEKQRSKSQSASQVQNIQDRFNGKTYKCPQCPSKFTNAVSLTIHQRVHQGDRPHKCQKCLATFTKSSSLGRHMDTRHGNGTRHHACPHCPAKFIRSTHCQAHMIVHTREGPGLHRCTHCTAKFLHKKSLTNHLKLHDVKKSYKCNRCSLEFSSREACRKHQKTHSDKQGTRNKQPSNAASNSKGQGEVADKRISSADRPYTCQKCSRKFLSSQQLEYHMVWHSGDRRHECTHCSQTFPTAQSLKEHRKTHAGERPFRCPMCPADFEWKSNLKRHLESKHFKESDENNTSVSLSAQRTPLDPQKARSDGSNKNSSEQQKTSSGIKNSCSVCSLKFRRMKDLKKHRKTHSGGKPAKSTDKRQRCPECNVSFCDLRSLERHQRIHTGEKPFACPMCSLRFGRKDHVMRHVAKHHAGDEPANASTMTLRHQPCPEPRKKVYSCPECPARFSTVELLTGHKKIHPISSKDKATPSNNSSASNQATLEVMETQVVHEPGAASHVEAVVVANLEQLPIQESEEARVQKVLQTDGQSGSPESSEFAQYHKSLQQSGSSSSAESNTTRVATVSRQAASTHASPLLTQRMPHQKANEQVPAPGNVPLLHGLWQRTDTTSPPQGLVPVRLSYGEALQAGETILQASMANSYCGWDGNTIRQQVTETNSSANSPGTCQVSSARTNQQLSLDTQPPNQGQASSYVGQNNEAQNSDKSKQHDIRYFCIGCKQVFATDKDLKDHLQGSRQEVPGQGESSRHRIVMLQKKTTVDQKKTSACSEANVLVVPKQSMNGVVMNCSHVFCVLCAGKVNINDLSHHVKIKHGIHSLEGEYPFGQATSCMTCSRRLYGEEDVQLHTSQRHIVLRDTAGPFLAYDNTQRSHTDGDPVEDYRQHTASTNERNVSAEESSLSRSDLCNRMATNSSSGMASLHSPAMATSSSNDNRETVLSKGGFSLNDAQKKKFLMISRAADACLKKKRYLVIRGSDGTDRSVCSSPQTDCGSSHDTTPSPPPNTLEQPCHIKTEGEEKSGARASNRLKEQPNQINLNTDSQDATATTSLQKQLALVAGILSSTLAKTSSTELKPKMTSHRDTINSQVTKPALQTKGGRGFLSSVAIKTEPVTADVESANASVSAPADVEDMKDLGDVTAINEPLKAIKEEAILDDL